MKIISAKAVLVSFSTDTWYNFVEEVYFLCSKSLTFVCSNPCRLSVIAQYTFIAVQKWPLPFNDRYHRYLENRPTTQMCTLFGSIRKLTFRQTSIVEFWRYFILADIKVHIINVRENNWKLPQESWYSPFSMNFPELFHLIYININLYKPNDRYSTPNNESNYTTRPFRHSRIRQWCKGPNTKGYREIFWFVYPTSFWPAFLHKLAYPVNIWFTSSPMVFEPPLMMLCVCS